MTVKLPATGDDTVSVDEAEPPEERLTLVGLSEVVGPDGDEEAERATVPEKLFRLANWIVEVTDDPAETVRLDGLAEMLKSGVVPGATETVCDEDPEDPLESVTVSVAVKLAEAEYACVTGLPVAVAPSPKAQLKV